MHNLTQATETSYGPRASTGNCAMKSLTQFGEDPNTWKIQKNACLLWHRQYDANFQGNPLLRATKRHLNDSETVKNSEKL